MILSQVRLLSIAMLLAAASSFCKADVVFSDLGPGNTYNCCLNWGIGIPPFDTISAMSFTPSSSFDLNQIDLGLTWLGNTNSVIVSLKSDSAGLPGATIESWTVSSLPSPGSDHALVTVAPVSPVGLVGGQQYWIAAAPGASDTLAIWNWNVIGATGSYAQSLLGGAFIGNNGTLGAFDVLGTPVAEPSSIWVLCMLFFGLAAHFAMRNTRVKSGATAQKT